MNDAGPFFQLTAPDKMKLAELLLKAKGPSRTMADFAQLTGISTSTLSRIANGKLTKPLNHKLLRTVYDCSDSAANFSFNELLLANGTVEKEAYEKGRAMTQRLFSREEAVTLERHAKNAVVNALLARGARIQSVMNASEPDRQDAPFGICLYYDFSFYIADAPEPLWFFEVIANGRMPVRAGDAFRKAARVFLLDAWQPEFFSGKKYSFIFFRRRTFEHFVMTYRGAPIHAAVSAILVDPAAEEVIEESWLSECAEDNGILSRPVIADDGRADTGSDGDNDDDWTDDDDNSDDND